MLRFMWLGLVVVALLGASDLHDDPRFLEAQKHREAFEYDEAADLFEAVAKSDLSSSERAKALVWVGVTAAEARSPQRATKAFEQALALDPTVDVDADISPKIVQLFREVKARTKARAKPP